MIAKNNSFSLWHFQTHCSSLSLEHQEIYVRTWSPGFSWRKSVLAMRIWWFHNKFSKGLCNQGFYSFLSIFSWSRFKKWNPAVNINCIPRGNTLCFFKSIRHCRKKKLDFPMFGWQIKVKFIKINEVGYK